MPSKAFNPAQITLYFDHAALNYAFSASYGSVDDRTRLADAAPLAALVEEWTKNANVCISLNHAQELADWPQPDAMDMADWLDGLPLVWARSVQHLFVDEAAAWMERSLGPSQRIASPWASCLSAVFESSMTPQAQSVILPRASIRDLVKGIRERRNTAREVTMDSAAKLYANNRWAKEQKWSDERKAAYLAAARDDGVRELAKAARQKLRLPWGQEAYDVSQALLVAYRASPLGTMRGYAVQQVCITDFAGKARRDPLSTKQSSTLWDIAHASVGAAYADVVTCDKRTAPAVLDSRRTLQLAPALVSKPNAEFISAVEKAITATPVQRAS